MQKKVFQNTLVWLRNDLRIQDNEPLSWSNTNSVLTTPVYFFDPRHYEKTHNYWFPKTGNFRAKFLLESVADLRENLRKRGSNLLVMKGKPESSLETIFKNAKFEALVFQKEVTKEEIDVENAVKEFCDKNAVKFLPFWGATLYHLDDLPFNAKNIPSTYTEFRKEVELKSKVRIEIPETSFKSFPTEYVDLIENVDFSDLNCEEPKIKASSAFNLPGGESSALAHFENYLSTNQIQTYKQTRNQLIGLEYSTKLSPFLAHGNLSPRAIYKKIRNYEKTVQKSDSTYWVIFELLWRDYFRFISLKHGNRIFYPSGILGKKIPWGKDKEIFEKWRDGKTGVPFVDANMRELMETGWMSNRGRQNVASFLVKDLGIDWRMGAEWFESQLLDYDVCSNYGNWNYSAGVGNDPRENRKFNVIKQGLDYDPEAKYVQLWIPELCKIKGNKAHIPWALKQHELGGIRIGVDYPVPIVVAKEWQGQFSRIYNDRPRGGQAGQPARRGIDFYFKSSNSKK